ncbi:MAG: hypothetical protein IJ622_10645 [Bacteroidales bacterium]|nr:hypothetical protein [Bacteroidales bacterium]
MHLQEFGNLGGASIPMLMTTSIADELRNRPLTLLCSSFGLGLTWGTKGMRTNKVFAEPLHMY